MKKGKRKRKRTGKKGKMKDNEKEGGKKEKKTDRKVNQHNGRDAIPAQQGLNGRKRQTPNPRCATSWIRPCI